MFEIKRGEQGEIVVSGRFDASQVGTAESFLDAVTQPAVMDLSGLQYISSAGLGALLKVQKRLMAGGGGLTLVKANHHINDIFRYSGFDKIFDIRGEDDG